MDLRCFSCRLVKNAGGSAPTPWVTMMLDDLKALWITQPCFEAPSPHCVKIFFIPRKERATVFSEFMGNEGMPRNYVSSSQRPV